MSPEAWMCQPTITICPRRSDTLLARREGFDHPKSCIVVDFGCLAEGGHAMRVSSSHPTKTQNIIFIPALTLHPRWLSFLCLLCPTIEWRTLVTSSMSKPSCRTRVWKKAGARCAATALRDRHQLGPICRFPGRS
jgi:hypothetical protein